MLSKPPPKRARGKTKRLLSVWAMLVCLALNQTLTAGEPAAQPQKLELLLKAAKKESDLSATTKGSTSEVHAQQSLAHAQRALAADANCARAHLAVAVAYGRLTDFVGNKTKIEYSKIIGEEAKRATELDPGNDLAWHILGRWNAGLADVGSLQRTLCKLVYGTLPTATHEEAVRCLKKASAIAPEKINHQAELAHVYTAMGKATEATDAWREVLKLKPVDDEDIAYQAEARTAVR